MVEKPRNALVEPRLRPVKRVEVPESPREKWGDLAAALDNHRGERLLILLCGYPDPDNIGSGLALKFLANSYGIESRLLSFYEVSHQENRALVKQLELDLWLYEQRCDLDSYSLYAFVDTQRTDTPIQDQLSGKTCLAFVDHHKDLGDVVAEGVLEFEITSTVVGEGFTLPVNRRTVVRATRVARSVRIAARG